MADGIPTDPPNSREIDFGALVRRALGDEYHKHEKVYQVGKGRTFESSDYGTQGIYRTRTAIVRSGSSQSISNSSITLASNANGSAYDYVGKTITLTRDSPPNTASSTIVDYNVTSRVARLVPTLDDYMGAALADGARTNLCLQSEDFATTWTNNGSTESVNAVASPDGAITADKCVEDTSVGAEHNLSQNITWTAAVHTVSVFAKAGERTWIQLQTADGTTTRGAYFDLSLGAVGTLSNATATITAYPNGWYRCTMTGSTAYAAAAGVFQLLLATADNTSAYTGNGTSGAYFWGAQIEAAATASSYIPTTTVAVERLVDEVTYSITP